MVFGSAHAPGRQHPRHRFSPARSASLWAVLVPFTLVGILSACTGKAADTGAAPSAGAATNDAKPLPHWVCGHSVLNSPYSYHGAPGRYASGARGLPTYGKPGSDFPRATAGVVLPPGKHSYAAYQLEPRTVYYLLPGFHTGAIQADAGDAFVGGRFGGQRTVLTGAYRYPWAIDSNYSLGNQPGVTIEYLTIEKYSPRPDAAAINQSSNTGWTLRNSTVTLNAPGAGMIAGADNVLKHNCLTLNGQYGFQASNTSTWGHDALTGGPYNITVAENEISYNDTCDFEGLLDNSAIGWSDHNPVPAKYRNPHCGKVAGDGNQGGFKLWQTNGVTIKGNYIHNNWGPGIWADTNNANTTYTGNTIMNNDGEAIIEEISYNFSITGNYLANNGWVGGLANPKFPTPAIYVSQSGSDTAFSGIPACREASCARQKAYPDQSVISGNTLVNNGGSVLVWQNSDRFCSAGFDHVCTLVGSRSEHFTMAGCKANLPSATVDTATYTARYNGSPSRDWWNGCLWWSSNVKITHNVIDFDPGAVPHCDKHDWPDCGAGGIFAQYSVAAPYNQPGGWVILSQVTFFQGNTWSGNVYHGPSTFYAWNQSNGYNPVSWASWTADVAKGDKCNTTSAHLSGYCHGPFGQDAGSTYHSEPLGSPPPPPPEPSS